MTRWYCALAVGLVVLLSLAGTAKAQVPAGANITLQETLEKGLLVRTDRERAFIIQVVGLVPDTFPRDLVLMIFQKARFKHKKFPFRYFRVMMQRIAKTRRVELPF